MPKGDINLPNQSGVIDPRIAREQELQGQRAFLRRSQASAGSRAPVEKRSVARRMVEGIRTISGRR